MLVPYHNHETLYLGENDIPPYLGYWLPMSITKMHPLPDFLGIFLETTAPKYPLSRKNGNAHAAPRAFE